MIIRIRDDRLLEQWGELLDDAAGRASDLLAAIERGLEPRLLEHCSITWNQLAVGRARREALVIRHHRLADYRIVLSAWDVGRQLQVCRFVTAEPAWWKAFLAKRFKGDAVGSSLVSSIFAEHELRAWLTIVHRATLVALEALSPLSAGGPEQTRREPIDILELW